MPTSTSNRNLRYPHHEQYNRIVTSIQFSVSNLYTFNHVSVRFDAAYSASTSRDFTMIPSHEELNASLKNEFILAKGASEPKRASSASTYNNTK